MSCYRRAFAYGYPASSSLHRSSKLSLVNYNDPAFNSYGKKNGENAPVSKIAAKAYALGLGHLLEKGKKTNSRVGDIVFTFWNDPPYEELISSYHQAIFDSNSSKNANEDEEEEGEDLDQAPKRQSSKKKKNVTPDQEAYKVYDALNSIYLGHKSNIDVDAQEAFYILGLLPGQGRGAVKLWKKGTVREIVGNTLQHLQNMNIVSYNGSLDEDHPPLRSVYSMVRSVSTSSKSDKWSQQLIQSIVESIVSATPYPQSLPQACLGRIRHTESITELRAAILKAYINRKYHKEVLTMALEKTNTQKAYLLGRLFALLEIIQKEAIGKSINASIRDRFYGAASTTPNVVFSRLLQLSAHHLSKIKKEKGGWTYILDKELGEILGLISGDSPEFPPQLLLDEQCIFAVGYYHQKCHQLGSKVSDEQNQTEINQ